MSELILELVFNVIGGLLEVLGEVFFEAFTSSDTTANRIFWGLTLVILGGIIWWEIR